MVHHRGKSMRVLLIEREKKCVQIMENRRTNESANDEKIWSVERVTQKSIDYVFWCQNYSAKKRD